MIGISIAANREWKAVSDRFQINFDSCNKYPFGEYFITEINDENLSENKTEVLKLIKKNLVIKFLLIFWKKLTP